MWKSMRKFHQSEVISKSSLFHLVELFSIVRWKHFNFSFRDFKLNFTLCISFSFLLTFQFNLKTETIKKKTINTIKHRAEPIQSKQSMFPTDVLIDLIETFDRSKQYCLICSGTKNEICVSLVYSENGNKISFPFPLYTRETQISFFVPGFVWFYWNDRKWLQSDSNQRDFFVIFFLTISKWK